jgi:hypothetical protein
MSAALPFSEEWLFRMPKTPRLLMCQGQLRRTIRRRENGEWVYYCAHCGRTARFER